MRLYHAMFILENLFDCSKRPLTEEESLFWNLSTSVMKKWRDERLTLVVLFSQLHQIPHSMLKFHLSTLAAFSRGEDGRGMGSSCSLGMYEKVLNRQENIRKSFYLGFSFNRQIFTSNFYSHCIKSSLVKVSLS